MAGAQRIATAVSSSADQQVPESAKIAEKVGAGLDKIRDLYLEKDSGKISNKEFSGKLGNLENSLKN